MHDKAFNTKCCTPTAFY